MNNEDINWVYIRQRLKFVMLDCLISDELLKEIYSMLVEIKDTNEKGKAKVLLNERSHKEYD